jgi:hypothetical protein
MASRPGHGVTRVIIQGRNVIGHFEGRTRTHRFWHYCH